MRNSCQLTGKKDKGAQTENKTKKDEDY